MANPVLYSFYGTLAIRSYEKMADRVYEIDWPELPVELQKYFILIIGNVQKPIHYHGFGVVILNMETLSKVCVSDDMEHLLILQLE